MQHKVSELSGALLDAAVAKANADQPFVPCTVKDAERCDSGSAYWARDKAGALHMIGSKNPTILLLPSV